MCEMLVLVHDQPGENEFKRWDIIFVANDKHTWSRRESKAQWIAEGFDPAEFPGKHYIFKVPGVPKEATKLLKIPHATKHEFGSIIHKARAWTILGDELPANLKDKLNKDYEITLPPGQMRKYLRNKISGADFIGFH